MSRGATVSVFNENSSLNQESTTSHSNASNMPPHKDVDVISCREIRTGDIARMSLKPNRKLILQYTSHCITLASLRCSASPEIKYARHGRSARTKGGIKIMQQKMATIPPRQIRSHIELP
mmetsp:Transcript_73507/g.119291  ORF Transcript_73507/g.119291 Transcript_73507/m.119291 type:complete len:120 (+) Transcript_73507:59-418(+)